VSRRRKLPTLSPGYIREFTVAVVCTDRGQHPEALIADLADRMADGTLVWADNAPAPVTGWEAADGSRTFRFTCNRCGRDVRLREPNVLAVIDTLREAGTTRSRPVLDISLL
jgi:hypothetical protein